VKLLVELLYFGSGTGLEHVMHDAAPLLHSFSISIGLLASYEFLFENL
jgi:hypothetical protein